MSNRKERKDRKDWKKLGFPQAGQPEFATFAIRSRISDFRIPGPLFATIVSSSLFEAGGEC